MGTKLHRLLNEPIQPQSYPTRAELNIAQGALRARLTDETLLPKDSFEWWKHFKFIEGIHCHFEERHRKAKRLWDKDPDAARGMYTGRLMQILNEPVKPSSGYSLKEAIYKESLIEHATDGLGH
jgi:hypothetical protein